MTSTGSRFVTPTSTGLHAGPTMMRAGPEVPDETPSSYGAVQRKLRMAGIVMSKRGDLYRVNFFGGLPDTARYAADLTSALEEGMSLASTRKGPAW